VCRLYWILCRLFSTASCTEVLGFATGVSYCGTSRLTATTLMTTLSRGLLRAARRHSQEWVQMSRRRCCVRLRNFRMFRDVTSFLFHYKLQNVVKQRIVIDVMWLLVTVTCDISCMNCSKCKVVLCKYCWNYWPLRL